MFRKLSRGARGLAGWHCLGLALCRLAAPGCSRGLQGGRRSTGSPRIGVVATCPQRLYRRLQAAHSSRFSSRADPVLLRLPSAFPPLRMVIPAGGQGCCESVNRWSELRRMSHSGPRAWPLSPSNSDLAIFRFDAPKPLSEIDVKRHSFSSHGYRRNATAVAMWHFPSSR